MDKQAAATSSGANALLVLSQNTIPQRAESVFETGGRMINSIEK
ncbi:hypothetical protein [Mesorhizobium sp. RIZ17]